MNTRPRTRRRFGFLDAVIILALLSLIAYAASQLLAYQEQKAAADTYNERLHQTQKERELLKNLPAFTPAPTAPNTHLDAAKAPSVSSAMAPQLQQQVNTDESDPSLPGKNGNPLAAQTDSIGPNTLYIPAIGLLMPVVDVDLEIGTRKVEIPQAHLAGRYDRTVPLGAPQGRTVIGGHANYDPDPVTGTYGPVAPMSQIGKLKAGDQIFVTNASGKLFAYVVVDRQEYPQTGLPAALFAKDGAHMLELFTCGGEEDANGWFTENVVVFAVPATLN